MASIQASSHEVKTWLVILGQLKALLQPSLNQALSFQRMYWTEMNKSISFIFKNLKAYIN